MLKKYMEFKQSTPEEINESERLMVLKAPERFDKYYTHASEANGLLNQFMASIDASGFIFTIFLSQVRKHLLLAIFSFIRQHEVQAMMDMRQVLEAGANAAYAIANPDVSHFADIGDDGNINPSQDLTNKRYVWLETNYPDGSKAIKYMKGSVNGLPAHSNIVNAMTNFSHDPAANVFKTPFFDPEDEYRIKCNLWWIANVAYGLMDLFYGVNRGRDVIKFIPNFPERLKALRSENDLLKAEIAATDRFKAAQSKSANPK
jgi:hypothetical protein